MRQPNKRAMIQPRLCIAALATITLVNAIRAEPATNQVEKPLRLELELTDGSRIIGTPTIKSVPIQTSYAKMEIPLKQIQTIKMGNDHEMVTVGLRNGDIVTGVITCGPVELATVFGKAVIGIAHIRKFDVMLGCGTGRKTHVLLEDFDNCEPATKLSELGWVPHGSSSMALSRTSNINPTSTAIDGKLASGRGGYVGMHKLFKQPIPADRDVIVSFRMSCAADMNQAGVGLYTNDDSRGDPDPEGVRLWATERTWYLQDCAFSEQGNGNNHGTIVDVDPYVDGTATATMYVMGSAKLAWAEVSLPDGRTVKTPKLPLDPSRLDVYRGVLVFIKCLTPKHRADIDDIRVSVMEPESTERIQSPR